MNSEIWLNSSRTTVNTYRRNRIWVTRKQATDNEQFIVENLFSAANGVLIRKTDRSSFIGGEIGFFCLFCIFEDRRSVLGQIFSREKMSTEEKWRSRYERVWKGEVRFELNENYLRQDENEKRIELFENDGIRFAARWKISTNIESQKANDFSCCSY